MEFSPIIKEVSFYTDRDITDIHNWSKCREQGAVEFLTLTDTFAT